MELTDHDKLMDSIKEEARRLGHTHPCEDRSFGERIRTILEPDDHTQYEHALPIAGSRNYEFIIGHADDEIINKMIDAGIMETNNILDKKEE